MKFCNKCGEENKLNTNFCSKCGNRFLEKDEAPPVEKAKTSFSKYIIFGLVLALILGGGYFWKINKDKESVKNNFLKNYDEAVVLVNKGDLEEGKKILNDLKEKDIYDEVDINKDLEIVTDLEKIKSSFLNGSEDINKQIQKFKDDYSGYYDKYNDILNNLEKDAKEYTEYINKINEIKELISNKEFEKAKKELLSLKNYNFKIEKISEKTNKEIESLIEDVESSKKSEEEKKQKEAKELEEMKKRRPVVTEPTGLGGVFQPEYEGQPMVTLKEDEKLWAPVVARYIGANSASELEINYFHEAAAAVYYRDKGIAVVKLNPYHRGLLVDGQGYEGSLNY